MLCGSVILTRKSSEGQPQPWRPGMIGTKIPPIFCVVSVACDRLISVVFEISWNSGQFHAVDPRHVRPIFRAAPQGDRQAALRGRTQNSGLHRGNFVVAALFSGGLMGWMAELDANLRTFAECDRHVPQMHGHAQDAVSLHDYGPKCRYIHFETISMRSSSVSVVCSRSC
jgi:hypothetical protein